MKNIMLILSTLFITLLFSTSNLYANPPVLPETDDPERNVEEINSCEPIFGFIPVTCDNGSNEEDIVLPGDGGLSPGNPEYCQVNPDACSIVAPN